MEFRDYFLSLSAPDRESLAERCNTTVKQLQNIACGDRDFSPELAIDMERETRGKFRVEQLAPVAKNKPIDWAYIRGARIPRSRQSSKTA